MKPLIKKKVKSFNSIMSSFIKAKEDLQAYKEDVSERRSIAKEEALRQVDISNKLEDEYDKTLNTISQLENIIGE